MGSSFFEYSIATSGLYAAKLGLEVTSNNIANAGTKGFSRQIIEQKASNTMRLAGIGNIGTGTEITGISQIRSSYLDKKYWYQVSARGEFDAKRSQLELLEKTFNALSDSGISKTTNTFFNSISELSFDANNDDYRKSFIQSTKQLVSDVNYFANNLVKQQSDVNNEINTIVTRINTIGQEISRLNSQIRINEVEGSNSNDLRDQRGVLIDELSKYVNLEIKEIPDSGNPDVKTMNVLINGQEFVTGKEVRQLQLVQRAEKANSEDAIGLYDIQWSNGVPLATNDLRGELKGNLDIRDGKDGGYKGIPYYMDKLNVFVRGLAASMNEGISYKTKNVLEVDLPNPIPPAPPHVAGTTYFKDDVTGQVTIVEIRDINGTFREITTTMEDIPSVTGHVNGYDKDNEKFNLLFSYNDIDGNPVGPLTQQDLANPLITVNVGLDYSKMNALNFTLSEAVEESPGNLACSKTERDPAVGDNQSDNDILLEFVKLKSDTTLFREGSIIDYTNSLSSVLATEKNDANNFQQFYKDSEEYVENQRMQVSGVSFNEEVNNILKYQQLYQVSAKLISVINNIYETTISGLGI